MAAAPRSAARPAAWPRRGPPSSRGSAGRPRLRIRRSRSGSDRVPSRTARAASVTSRAVASPALRAIRVSGCEASRPTWSDTIASSVDRPSPSPSSSSGRPVSNTIAYPVAYSEATLSRCAAACIASRSDTRAGARTSCSGASPRPPGFARAIAANAAAASRTSSAASVRSKRVAQRLVGSPRDRGPHQRREQEHDPQVGVGPRDLCRRLHPVRDQLPDRSPERGASPEHRAQRERRADHVGVGRIREIVGGSDVARLGR